MFLDDIFSRMAPSWPKPIIFAHRGASAHAPENTLAAFNLALEHGADAIELDAKLSADKQVIVIHDQTVDRTTTGTGLVANLPLSVLKQLDAGSHFDIAFRREKIPTLAEVLESLGQRTLINIELTNYASPQDDLPERACELVKKFGLPQRVLFSSFNPLALLRAHRILPGTPCGLLALPGQKGFWARSWLGRLIPHQALHPERSDVTPTLIARVHRFGRRIHAWTVNDPDELQRLFIAGLDGVFTDDPRLARKVLLSTRDHSYQA
jgi:glycerophosphoryl diester phosphodiesterase